MKSFLKRYSPYLLVLSFACAKPTIPVNPSYTPASPEPDWTLVGQEAVVILQELLKIPSVNPPGNELLVAEKLAELIRKEGIEAIVAESAPGRGNVMARLVGNGTKKPLILLCHIDVVPVEEEGWEVDPFGGIIKDEAIWGRGAIDDKGMCTANLLSFLLLHRQNTSLTRDIIFLATADEESHGTGAEFMLETFPEELSAEYLINEGGIGLIDAVSPGETLFAISVAEKGIVRLRLSVTGAPGHGSIPKPGQAPSQLVLALARLGEIETPKVMHEYIKELVLRLGKRRGGFSGYLMRHPKLAPGLIIKNLAKSPTNKAVISNTLNLTMIKTGEKINVIPAIAEAWIDSRILPGTTPENIRELVQKEVEEFGVKVEVMGSEPATTSSWDTELFRVLEKHLVDGVPNSLTAPILSPGYTDSRPFRERGIIAYGIVPFVVTQEEFAGMHGHNERLKISELGAGVRRLFRVLVEIQ